MQKCKESKGGVYDEILTPGSTAAKCVLCAIA